MWKRQLDNLQKGISKIKSKMGDPKDVDVEKAVISNKCLINQLKFDYEEEARVQAGQHGV